MRKNDIFYQHIPGGAGQTIPVGQEPNNTGR